MSRSSISPACLAAQRAHPRHIATSGWLPRCTMRRGSSIDPQHQHSPGGGAERPGSVVRGVTMVGLPPSGCLFLQRLAKISQRGDVPWPVRCPVDPAGHGAIRLVAAEQVHAVDEEGRGASEPACSRGVLAVDRANREGRVRQADVIERGSEQLRGSVGPRALRDHQQFDVHTCIMTRLPQPAEAAALPPRLSPTGRGMGRGQDSRAGCPRCLGADRKEHRDRGAFALGAVDP